MMNDQEPHVFLSKLRELSQNEKKLKQTQEGQELSEEAKERLREIEEEFLQTLQKLVKSPLTSINKFYLSQVKDVFNALSEKIEKLKDGSDKPKLLLLLQAASVIAYTNNSQEKVDNVNVLDEIMKREDDPRITLYALEIIQTIGSRRTNDYCDRAAYLCLAPNHLVSKEKHVTLFDIAKGVNKDGYSLVGADLFFEIEKQAFGLNDRSSTEVIRVPRSEFADLLASEKSKQLAESFGKENDLVFQKKLEAKISWLKFVSDENSLLEILQVQNQAFALACKKIQDELSIDNWKSEARHQDYISYLKDSYIKEAIELLKESGNKDLMYKIVYNMQRLIGKDQMQYISLDLLTKPQPKTGEQEEEREETSVLVKLMKDMASVKIVEDGLLLEKQATTEFLNSMVVKSSHFQFGLISLVYLIIRVLQASHGRSNNNYQDVVNGTLESLMKILDEPVQSGYDVFHPKVVFTAFHLLRACSRPRLDEQFDLVRRLSKRLLFESENLQRNYNFLVNEEDLFADSEQKERQNITRQILLILTELLQRDTQNVGISRRIQDAGVLLNLQKLLQFNNQEQGYLVDEVLPKYISIFGQICSNEPGLIPGFIKSGLITEVLKSIDSRLPNSTDTLDSLIFSISQFAIHQEGQEKIIESNIFKTLLERTILEEKDNKIFSNLAVAESQTLKILFSNLFDRNEAFKAQMREILENVYLDIIQRFVSQETVNYIRIIRQSDKTISQKLEESGNLKQQKSYAQVMAAINMILIVCQLTNDNMGHQNQSRHVVDIMKTEICEKLFNIFEKIGQVPSLNDLINQFKKIMKSLVEYTQFPTNFTSYIDRFQNHLVQFQSIIVKPLPEVTELDYTQNDGSEVADLEGYIGEEKERFLTKGEAVLFQTSLVITYVKTTSFLHNSTQQQLYQHKQILKILKPLFYLMRISTSQEQRLLQEALEGALNDPQNQSETEVKQSFIQENDAKLSILERNQQNLQLQLVAKARNAQSNNSQRLLIIRRSNVQDLYCKLSAVSIQLMQVRQGPREIGQINLHFIGKIMYKLSKEFKKEKLPKASELVLNDISFFFKLQSLQQNLIDFNQLTIKCWLDGPSFFTFFRKGGFSNIISCFRYLGSLLPVLGYSDTKWSVPFTNAYDDCCLKIKEFLQIMVLGRNSETHNQSILSMKMGGDIDSPKVLYQTFYNELCRKLLEFNKHNTEKNILKKYQSNRCTYLQDVILNLLQQASKSFSGCQLIKENARPNNHRGRVDPAHVQQLIGMGLNASRERIEQALQQTHNNVDNAANLLFEWQQMNDNGIDDEIEPSNGLNIDDGLSSNQSRDEGITSEDRLSIKLDSKMSDISAMVQKKRRQPRKVDESTFLETLKKSQLDGFNWIIEMIKADLEVVQTAQYREQLVSIMTSEKNENAQKTMFQQINMVFQKNLESLNILIKAKPEQKQLEQSSQDQIMSDVTTETKTNKKLIENLKLVSSDCLFIQKLINNSKPYFKEAVLKCFIYSKFFVSLKYLTTSFRENSELETDGELNGAYQQIILDVLILMFSIYQLTQMQITQYQNAKAHQDQCQRKITLYTKEMQTITISESLIQMLEEFSQLSLAQPPNKRSLKKPILTTLIAFIFRILMTHREWTDANLKQQYISKLFDIINSVKYQKVPDNQIFTSVSILHFENQKSLQNQMEKLVQKTLWMKYEQQNKEAENSKNETEVGHLLSKTNFNTFLTFFQPLSYRDQESFKNVVAQSCEIKTVKKMNTLSQDQAIIRLKEPAFNELKKQIQKERGSLKQFGKLFDFANDKVLKTQSKQSKKALLLLLSDSQQQAFQTVIQQIAERTAQFFEEFVTFGQLNAQEQKLLVPKSQLKNFSQSEDLSILVNLFKLSQAYPAATVCIMKSHPQPKKSFFNWLLRDFLVYQMINRVVVEQKSTNQSQEVKQEPIYEISFSLPSSSIKQLDTFILRSLNSLSGYNHLMSLNEQMIKHEVRTKLMLEALTSLHKSIKQTSSNQASANLASALANQIKQKCQIITSLSVIDSLVNYEGVGFNRQQAVAQDNFSNSIRVAVVRDATTKDSNLPPSFVKIAEELLTEVIDVTLPANADVINRSVQILKTIVDFMNAEKKKEEIALNQLRPSTDRSVLEERKEPREQMQLGSPRLQAGSPRLQALGAEQIEELSEDSHDDMALQPNPDVEDDDGIEDDDEDEEDQEDDEDNDEDDDDNDGDEEEKLEDAVMFIQEEEEDDSDQELELHRQDGDHDLFAEEEEDLESQEEIGLNHEQQADRGMRVLDIINAFNRELRPARQYREPRGQRAQVPETEWSQDEITVQRLLSNMRQAQAIQAVPASNQQLARAALGNPFQVPPWEGGHQAQEEKKTTIIEQIYDGLKMISEKDLFESVNAQRQILKLMIKEENQQREEEQKQANRQPFEDRHMIINQHQLNRIILDEAEEFPIPDYGANIFRHHELARLLGQRNNQFEDPMFARPVFQEFLANRGAGGWAAQNDIIFGHGEFEDLPHHHIPPNPAANENNHFSQSLRNLVQNQANQNESLGQQLLEVVSVQVEEVKEEPAKKVPTPPQQVDPLNPIDMSNDFLLGSIFGSRPNQPANESRNSERDQLRDMIQQNSRALNESMQNIQRENQQRMESLGLDQSAISRNMIEPRARSGEAILAQSQQPQPLEMIGQQQVQPAQIEVAQDQQQPLIHEQLLQPEQIIIEGAQIQQPRPLSPVQEPEIKEDEEMKVVEEEVKQPDPTQLEVQEEIKQQEQQMELEEVKQENQIEVEVNVQEAEQVVQQPSSGKTFGYDNALLEAHGIDPAILADLPEEIREELLSGIDTNVVLEEPPVLQQQQPAAQNEEEKQGEPVAAQQQQNNLNATLANELGLDPEFLANLPEDMQLELIQNEQFRQRNMSGSVPAQQQPRREAEQMDIASFIATVTEPGLRRDIFAGMDEATIQSLPPNLMAEARRVHENLRGERVRQRENLEAMERLAARAHHHIGQGRDGMDALFGNRYRAGAHREEQKQQPGGKSLDDVITQRQKQLLDELCSNEDIANAISQAVVSNDKLVETLLLILISNEKVECELIPCIQSFTRVLNQGVPVIRNKVVNAIIFTIKTLALNDSEALSLLYPGVNIKKSLSILMLVGCLRLLLRNNRSLMKYILKGLIYKEDPNLQFKNPQILKRQYKALKMIKNSSLASESSVQQEDQLMQQVTPQRVTILPPLVEIFSLIKTEAFKQDKILMRNLSLLIHQILKQFEIAIEELNNSNQNISSETIQSIAEVLSLDIIDANLLQDLGEFLYQISKKSKENFGLVSSYCVNRSSVLVEKLLGRLKEIAGLFSDITSKISPSKLHVVDVNYSPGQLSAYEEEKSEQMQVDTSIIPSLDITKNTSDNRSIVIKLPDQEEKLLKQSLRVHEESEILLRIFKLYNLFYEKFNKDKNEIGDARMDDDQSVEAFKEEDAIQSIQVFFTQDQVKQFTNRVSDVLKIVYKTNIEINDGVSNLIFCVFLSFYPEIYQSNQLEEKMNKELAEKDKAEKSKYNIKMLPLSESTHKQQEKFTLFRNTQFLTSRIEELNRFCLVNKRVINKLIKQKISIFINELEVLIQLMPNLLDFENKRTYFKKELTKLKRSHHHDQLQLYIRRDDIFMDSYAQLGPKPADELKGRLHISFTGERGQDAGGLTRDFFTELSKEMFNPNYSLFILSSQGSTYYPNPKSEIERDHLRYFKFIGRVIGKALFEECLLECYFVKSFYKIMVGEPLTFYDLEDFDNELFSNLKWCLENDVETLQQNFAIQQDYFGRTEEIELIPGGKQILVNNENKSQYIENHAHFKLYKSIQKQIENFLDGFYELVPKNLISIFNYKELELLISGLPNFDITDLKNNTEYMGYSQNSPQVQWLWEVLEQFENSDRAEFLQFVTGSSKVPVDGFKGLMGMRGPQKFTIAKIKTDDVLRLPTGHTCFNQIDMPEYPSKEILHERMLTAIKETKGFGFA